MSRKVAPLGEADARRWYIECPGCKYGHAFDASWQFNGDMQRPTFSPSLLVNATVAAEKNADGTKKYPGALRCHSYVTDGRIQFLSDCDHELANQTVDLPDLDF